MQRFLLQRIEDVRTDAMRDHGENKRNLLHLTDELNDVKVVYRDAISKAGGRWGSSGSGCLLVWGLSRFSL